MKLPWWELLALLLGWLLGQQLAYGATGTASWYDLASCRREGTSGTMSSTVTASWYSSKDACPHNHDPRCPMASGVSLYDQEKSQPYFAASWDYPFGTQLKVCRVPGNAAGVWAGEGYAAKTPRPPPQEIRCTVVEVTDRGPARGLYRRGRVLDLSRAAFLRLAPLSRGVIEVTVEAQIPDGA